MKAGKVSEAILKRSVIKTIKYKGGDAYIGSGVGNDAAVTRDGFVTATAVAGLLFEEENLYFDCNRCIYTAVNNVAAESGICQGILVDIIMPEKRLEPELKELMRYISGVCKTAKLEITGGNTEVCKSVIKPIVSFTAYGKYALEDFESPKRCTGAGYDIVMSKRIGISGTIGLAKEKYSELTEKFQASYIRNALEREDMMDVRREADIARKYGVRVMHDLSRGGIYLALWQLAEKTGKGVEADADKISVYQETIEICELYGINPYKLMSNGALLMVCEDGDGLCEKLVNEGVEARIIGKLTDNNDKVIVKNEDRRFIEPPRRDELEIFFG